MLKCLTAEPVLEGKTTLLFLKVRYDHTMTTRFLFFNFFNGFREWFGVFLAFDKHIPSKEHVKQTHFPSKHPEVLTPIQAHFLVS